MIPTNKLKKLVLQCIVKFMNSGLKDIWDECSNDLLETNEICLNALQAKEIFYKEILPDLSYNNFGYDNETVEKLKSLSKNIVTNTLQNDTKSENLTEITVDNNSDGASSIDWMEVDKDLNEHTVEDKMANLHAESLEEHLDEQNISTDNEFEGDPIVNAILAKYQIPGRVQATQDIVYSQESEQMFCFRESQLLNVFGVVENDPLATSLIVTENILETNDYDAYDYLCDGGRISDVANKFPEALSNSFDKTEHHQNSLKRKSSSLPSINLATNFDNNDSEIPMHKIRKSNSLHGKSFSSFTDLTANKNELEAMKQRFEDNTHEICEKSTPNNSGNKIEGDNAEIEVGLESRIEDINKEVSNVSKIIENNGTEKSTDEIVAEIQKRLNAAKNPDEILKIIEENVEYCSMLEIPFNVPETLNNDKPKNEEETNESSKSIKESQNVEISRQQKVKPARTKFIRNLKVSRPQLNYDSTQFSDLINPEESPNLLLLNDTILSGSHHKDCIGEVKELNSMSPPHLSKSHGSQLSISHSPQPSTYLTSQSQNHSSSIELLPGKIVEDPQISQKETIEKLQALINATDDPEELWRILEENEQYCCYLTIPFNDPLTKVAKSPEKSKEEKIEEIQKQLDAALDEDIINKILKDHEEYLEYLTIPFFPVPCCTHAANISTSKNSTLKVKQETQNEQKQALKVKTENIESDTDKLDRSSSRTELSFLLGQNINLKKRNNTVRQPKKLDENVIIDLIDDD